MHTPFRKLGYREAKVWCPPLGIGDTANTPGLWPAFWLAGVNGIRGARNSGGDAAENRYHGGVLG